MRGCLHLSLKSAGKPAVLDCDAILIAAGLIPRSETLSGVSRRANGEVIVNEYMQTNLPNVYACGDVTGPPYLTPVARLQGIIAETTSSGNSGRWTIPQFPSRSNLWYELGFCSDGSTSARPLTIPGPAGPGTFWSVPASDTGLAKILVEPGRHDQRHLFCLTWWRAHCRLHGVSHEAPCSRTRVRGLCRGPPFDGRDLWPRKIRIRGSQKSATIPVHNIFLYDFRRKC